MHDIHVIRTQHLELEARKYALRLLGCVEKFIAGEGDMAKAQELVDKVYQRPHEIAAKPIETGPHTYTPMSDRSADGLTVAS